MKIPTVTAGTSRDQAIQRTQVYPIIKNVKEGSEATDKRGKKHEKKRIGSTLLTLIAKITAEVEKDEQHTCC